MSPQGKRGRPAAKRGRPIAEQTAGRIEGRRRLALLVLAVFVIGSFIVVAAAQGIGAPDIPEGDIAVVEEAPDGEVTREDFEASLEQTAASQQLPKVPAEDDPQYEVLADAAISDLLLARWVLGEAEERGVSVTDTQIDDELQTVKEQQFQSEQQFEQFLEDSGFTLDEVRERLELQLISDAIQDEILPRGEQPEVSDEEIETFYEENPDQFATPESRDARVILTKTEAEADDALAALEQDSSPKSFEQVAKEFSIDEATKSTGGLREAVVEGQSEPALDEEIFAAPEGELVGPFETDAGFYVLQVEKITDEVTTPLDEARRQIQGTLIAARQQEIAQTFQEDFQSKWVARTFCAEGYRTDRCSNADPPPDPCTAELADSEGCPAPVASTRPIAPGTATVFGAPATAGLPQGPLTPPPPEGAPGAVPPGLSPIPGAPPGTVPPGAAPPGTAPPGAPPGG